MEWTGGPLTVGHEVLPDQMEIDPKTGRVRPIQAARHEVGLWMMDLNILANLGITKRLDIRIRMPIRYVQVSARFLDDAQKELQDFVSIHHRDETLVGPGDPTVQLGVRLLRPTRRKRWLLESSGGLSIPLGRIEPDPYKAGRKGEKHQHIMFGSGTFDLIATATAGYVHPNWQLFLNLIGQGSFYENSFGLRRGLQLRAALTAESRFGLKNWAFQAQAAFSIQQPGLWSGQVDPDAASGRKDLFFTLGTMWRPNQTMQISLRCTIPVNLALEGGELNHPLIVSLGFQKQFRIFGK